MNRILFNVEELDADGRATFGGVRAEHVLTVLHGEVGQALKTGVVDGLIGTGVIERIEGEMVTVKCVHDREAPPPWIDLILAPPRPRAMKRLLPQLAAMGVGRIVLVGAAKVEKAFWGAQLLKEAIYRPLLVDGLMQAGTTALPTIQIERAFGRWLDGGRFEEEFGGQKDRIVAHPSGVKEFKVDKVVKADKVDKEFKVDKVVKADKVDKEFKVDKVVKVDKVDKVVNDSKDSKDPNDLKDPKDLKDPNDLNDLNSAMGRPILAIGPEGGWTDDEVTRLEAHGFRRMSLGPRILRTDTATIALLARLMPEADAFSSTTKET